MIIFLYSDMKCICVYKNRAFSEYTMLVTIFIF